MAAGVQDTSLEAQIRELREAITLMRSRNPLDSASVTNAAGKGVLLSQLAFGAVPAQALGNIVVWGSTGGPGGTAWSAQDGPGCWVYVTGGKLRVDIAARLGSWGNNCSMYYTWGVYGPSAAPGGAAGPEVVPPDSSRALEVFYPGTSMEQLMGAGTFGFHENLAPGWYYVAARYSISYSGNPSAQPYGEAYNRRMLATPF